MPRTTRLVLVGVATASIGVAAGSATVSASDPSTAKQVLDQLCEARGGTAYFTPYAISRCQEARANKGFELEELVCEGLAGGEFNAFQSPGRMSRANWVCLSG